MSPCMLDIANVCCSRWQPHVRSASPTPRAPAALVQPHYNSSHNRNLPLPPPGAACTASATSTCGTAAVPSTCSTSACRVRGCTALHCTVLHFTVAVCVWGGGTIRRCAAAMRSLQLPNTSTPTVPAPGIVNFIDARTQWIDDGFKRALQDGIKQVCLVLQGSEVLTSCQSGP